MEGARDIVTTGDDSSKYTINNNSHVNTIVTTLSTPTSAIYRRPDFIRAVLLRRERKQKEHLAPMFS
jgi:hypothetical protein